jgi:hypothetical protein
LIAKAFSGLKQPTVTFPGSTWGKSYLHTSFKMAQASAIDINQAMDLKRIKRPEANQSMGKDKKKITVPRKSINEPFLVIPIILLLALIPFGIFSMHILMHRNGYYAAMIHLRDFGPHLLPGTEDPLVRRFTGNELLDYWLTVLVCFFANTVDGSVPELSIFCLVFAAGLGPVLVVVYFESLRRGRMWGLLYL